MARAPRRIMSRARLLGSKLRASRTSIPLSAQPISGFSAANLNFNDSDALLVDLRIVYCTCVVCVILACLSCNYTDIVRSCLFLYPNLLNQKCTGVHVVMRYGYLLAKLRSTNNQ